MSHNYRLRVEASKTKSPDESLTQAELHDFFEKLDYPDGIESEIVNGREYIYWQGTTCLRAGTSTKEQHEQIKDFLQEVTEAKEGDLKVKTMWLDLDHYDETIGDAKV